MSAPPLPFLRSQKLYTLLPAADPREAVHPERFHAARKGEGREDDGPPAPDETEWEELPRPALVGGEWAGRPLDRVAFTTDAGIGKTYNCRWLECELNAPGRLTCAFTIPVGDLKSDADVIRTHLVPLVRNPAIPGHSKLNPKRVEEDLDRMRRTGRIVLLFDGLDQAGSEHVATLARLIHPAGDWGGCRVVVAGRPFALDKHWDTLFAPHPWRFVQIGEFDADQQRAVLGPLADGTARIDAIPEDARPLFTVPRVLQYLRSLPEAHLAGLKTVADVYWRATGYMLIQALRERLSETDVLKYRAILGALAFGMYADSRRDEETGERVPNLDRVPADRMTAFRIATHGRLAAALRRLGIDSYPWDMFEDDCRKLSDLNAVLNHGWLDVNLVGEQETDLLWRNASLQEFFAAYWAVRWGSPEDHALVREWVVEHEDGRNRGFYWFWRYATEMPDRAIDSETPPRQTWQGAMAVLYDGSAVDEEGRPIRSAEFIYRSWAGMAGAAARAKFLGEWPKITRGESGPEAKRLAGEMLAGFIALVGNPDLVGDTGEFWMGATESENGYSEERPRHRVKLTKPYMLHRYCVTNLEYELFDPRHAERRWAGEPHPLVAKGGLGSDDGCPVVNVDWYGAWCYAVWVGCRLPTEAEWEYGCRAGRETPYSVGDGETLTAAVCHFGQPFTWGHTVAVGGLPGGENGWGFHQMHGNVWEWVGDWYRNNLYTITPRVDPVGPESGLDRVGRGGGCSSSAGDCRSAYRVGGGPWSRNHGLGFRLAAVPPSGRPGG